MDVRVAVTAAGIISALGAGRQAHVAALRSCRSGIAVPRFLKSALAPHFMLGEAGLSDDELAAQLGLPGGDNGYTRTALLSLAAFDDMLADVPIAMLREGSAAFINANTVGGMSKMEHIYANLTGDDTDAANLKYINTLDCSDSTDHITARYGLKPLTATISTACSSSAAALMLGARLIKQGVVKRAVCGGGDALSRFTLNGFHSLKNVDKRPCRPFDQHRNGLNLGEAAGYCLLEREDDARQRGAPIMAILSGYANTNDAYHATAPAPDGAGAYRTMSEALQKAGLQPGDINYVNAHGTATISNDLAEGNALHRMFGNKMPYFSSTKPYTGHTLAAAGVIEAIFSIWAMQERITLPNLNFETPMEETGIMPVTKVIENVDIRHVLSNSFGFGGSNVSLVFSQP